MLNWLKNLFTRPRTGADWLEHRQELARTHLARERKRKIEEELGPKWIGHEARYVQRKEQ